VRDEGVVAVVVVGCCSWLDCDALGATRGCIYLRILVNWFEVRDWAKSWLKDECVVGITFRMGDEGAAAGIYECLLFIRVLDICDIVIHCLLFEIQCA
jgi:hypothetical protein